MSTMVTWAISRRVIFRAIAGGNGSGCGEASQMEERSG
jgi:hypothetical protein